MKAVCRWWQAAEFLFGGDYGVEAVLFGYAVGEGVAFCKVFLGLGGSCD